MFKYMFLSYNFLVKIVAKFIVLKNHTLKKKVLSLLLILNLVVSNVCTYVIRKHTSIVKYLHYSFNALVFSVVLSY